MEESKQQQQQQHQQTSSGGRPADLNLTDKKISPKEENIGSGNPSSNADEVAASANTTTSHLESTYTSGPLPTLATQESTYFYGGYDNNAGSWDDYHRYANANNLQVLSPAMYGDNASVLYHSGFGIDSQMAAYGQFSPMASPMSPFMLDGQLYSPHQYPSFLPQPPSPGIPQHGNQNIPMSQNEFVGGAGSNSGQQDRFGDNNNNVVFGPGAAAGSAGGGYYVPFGSFGEIGGLSGGEQPLSNRPNSESGGSYMSPQLTPSAIYPPPFGILGPYDQNIAQFSPQPRPSHGFGTMANPFAQNFPHSSSYQGLNYSTVVPPSSWRGNNQSRLTADRSGRRERDSVFISDDSHGDRNRGPRALKPKVKTSSEEISSSVVPNKNGASVSEDVYNLPDFGTDYENARFFVIKSYSEDNVHKSIKYKVWASTPLGNRKLDAAYHELKETKSSCPLFLLFSVNASGQFCGVAEMTGPVDFENDAEYWQQDRWSGQFPVKWCIIKDVPNSRFRHILLENNDNKPVTHSRDTQEVKLEQGIEILKIFKEHDAETSILDDFSFYDERERTLQDRKSRQRPISSSVKIVAATSSDAAAADVSINQLSDRFTETFKLEDGNDVTTPPK